MQRTQAEKAGTSMLAQKSAKVGLEFCARRAENGNCEKPKLKTQLKGGGDCSCLDGKLSSPGPPLVSCKPQQVPLRFEDAFGDSDDPTGDSA